MFRTIKDKIHHIYFMSRSFNSFSAIVLVHYNFSQLLCRQCYTRRPCCVSVQLRHHLLSLCLSSTVVNSRVLYCQTPGLQVLCAGGDILSQGEVIFKRVCIYYISSTTVYSPNPFQSFPLFLPYPVHVEACHCKPRGLTDQFNSVSRSFNLRWRLIKLDIFTPHT